MTYLVDIPDQEYFRGLVKCQSACPVGTDARGYVRAIAAGDFEKAYLIARGPNPLASMCGRVCGAPCEAACRRSLLDEPVSIRALKRFATERFGVESGKFQPLDILRRVLLRDDAAHACEGEEELRTLFAHLERIEADGFPDDAGKVAIIGAGPAGLACAHDLALLGIKPIVFDAEEEPAGMLIYGVPEYRLPRDLIRAEVGVIRALGVEFHCNTCVGVDIGFDQIVADHDAVVIAVGAKNSRSLPLPGLQGPGVLGGVEFLRDVSLRNLPKELGNNVVVVGGGNVAYDVARTVVRQIGIDVSRTALRQPGVTAVTLASLESLDEMPADDTEILEGDEEGIRRLNSVGPVQIDRDRDGHVEAIWFKQCLRVFNDAGQFSPTFDEKQQTKIPCDTVILSIGQSLDLSFIDPDRDGGKLDKHGWIVSDTETRVTSRPGVFVAGDVAYGPRLMIDAVASGKQVARAVHQHLKGKDPLPHLGESHRQIDGYSREPGYEKTRRIKVPVLPVQERLQSQDRIVELGYQDEEVRREASRCFDCGVNPIFDGERCVLCGGCVDVCPQACLKIVSFDRLEPNPDLLALRDRL
ncbi:MAG: FAD-dependent oxidoreductase, partial [Planctomycetota bacterium]